MMQNQTQMVQNLPQRDEGASVKVSDPFKYTAADRSKLDPWLFQLQLLFRASPNKFKTPISRVNCALSWLSESLQLHFSNLEQKNDSFLHDWSIFEAELKTRFGPDDPVGDAAKNIAKLKMQDNQQVLAYDLEFDRYAVRLPWGDSALAFHYYNGLPE